MDIRTNAGYVITSSIHIGESEFVLGVNMNEPSQFVTWRCSGGSNYFWGHYFSEQFAAEKDLVARAQEEISSLEQRKEYSEKQKSPKGKERER